MTSSRAFRTLTARCGEAGRAKDLRQLLSERLRSEPLGSGYAVPTGSAAPVWSGSPYPGLRPFRTEEASIFFARGREVDALISRLRDPAQRFLAIVGASGSGKSSLIYAGLLPRLAAGGIEGSQHWPVLAFTPGASGDNPLLALASELKGRLPMSAQSPQIEIANRMAKSSRLPEEYLEALLADRPSGAVLVLLIDQLEELLTHAAESHKRTFIEFLARAISDPRVRVLATIRADFLPQCAAEPALAALLQAGTFVLGSPGLAALADMIRKPAERAGLEIDPALIDKIVTDAGGDPGGSLPLVAFCLEELYEQTAPEHRLTLDAYRAIGGLRGAINRRIGELLGEFQETETELLETALPDLFHALVHVDAAGKVARQWASRDELAAASAPVPQLVEKLIKGRLLQAGEATGRAAVTLAHEVLIEEWPSLNQWLTANRAQMQRVQRLLLNLASPESSDRIYATVALGQIGPGVVEVPSLRTALSDPDGNVRRAAVEALGQIGPGALEVVPNLIPLLSEANGEVRWAAAKALGQIGPGAADTVPALLRVLMHADDQMRWAAAEALAQFGPAASEAVPALVSALGDANHAVRTSAAQALGRIGREVAEVVSALITALGDGANLVAIQALGQIGPPAVEAVPALISVLSEATSKLRRAAVEALGKIGPDAAETVPALISVLNDADKDVRRTVVEALGQIGPDAAETVPALISVRAGTPCQSPPVQGRRRCRLHGGLSPGAPRGSRNGNRAGVPSNGLLETVGIDPITGSKRRKLTSAGREQAELEAQAKHATKH
jgi:HEAT repeat protein